MDSKQKAQMNNLAGSRQPHPDVSIKKANTTGATGTAQSNLNQSNPMYNASQLTQEQQRMLLMQMQKKQQQQPSGGATKKMVGIQPTK